MTTHFGVANGFQIISVPDVPVVGSRTATVDAAGVHAEFDFAVQFLQRFELNADLRADAFSGTGVGSIIVGGAGYSYGGSLGAGATIFRGPTTELSARLQGDVGSAHKILLLNLLNGLASGGRVQTVLQIIGGNLGRLVTSSATRGAGTANLNLAQSIGKAFGLQLTAGVTVAGFSIDYFDETRGRPTSTDLTLWTPHFAAEVEMDVRRLVPQVPLAVNAEYSLDWTHVSGGGDEEWFDPTSSVAFGLYYSGRRELSLGVSYILVPSLATRTGIDANARTYPVGRPDLNAFLLSMRYIW